MDTSLIVAGNNDRTVFDPKALADLAQSIRENGLIQPITVRPLEDTELFQVVAGERRFRACTTILGWDDIPAIVADLTDQEAAATMLAENVSRADIDAIDEANAYANRMTLYGWTVADCAKKAGASEIRIRFRLKLLRLRPDIQALIRGGNIQLGYAQILADADLDSSRQLIAVAHLRDNLKPTPGWFRHVVNQLLSQQAQGALIEDLPILTGEPIQGIAARPICEPPHPSTTKPPKNGGNIGTILENQAGFWQEADIAWGNIGKPFKRQECEAAALAIQSVLLAI